MHEYGKHRSLIVLVLFTIPALAADFTGKVVSIADGDTITILDDHQQITVRLYGIDCPERKQPFGTRAQQFTGSLAHGKTVSVKVKDIDRYGRTVGVVTLPDGKNLNLELVKAGLAWWYRRYAPRDSELEKAEKQARADRKGLWSQPNPVAPWEWRRR